jgi:transcription elongation factor B subunit 1
VFAMADLIESEDPVVLEEKREDQIIILKSNDNHSFVIPKNICVDSSKTINEMLQGPGEWSEKGSREITFNDIKSNVLEMVCKYFYYRDNYIGTKMDVPEFDIRVEVVINLLKAANFLDT